MLILQEAGNAITQALGEGTKTPVGLRKGLQLVKAGLHQLAPGLVWRSAGSGVGGHLCRGGRRSREWRSGKSRWEGCRGAAPSECACMYPRQCQHYNIGRVIKNICRHCLMTTGAIEINFFQKKNTKVFAPATAHWQNQKFSALCHEQKQGCVSYITPPLMRHPHSTGSPCVSSIFSRPRKSGKERCRGR